MLALTRRIGESVILTLPDGRRVEFWISDKSAEQVRLGIDAPDDVRIDRSEVIQRREREAS